VQAKVAGGAGVSGSRSTRIVVELDRTLNLAISVMVSISTLVIVALGLAVIFGTW
jgi:hypothetical protein